MEFGEEEEEQAQKQEVNKKGKKGIAMEEDTAGERVFICVGKNKETEQRAVWLMTLN